MLYTFLQKFQSMENVFLAAKRQPTTVSLLYDLAGVARAGEASTYSRRIAYIPADSNHISNF